MQYPEPTPEETSLLRRIADVIDDPDDSAMIGLVRQLGWPLHRVLIELERAGVTERPPPLPLP